MRAFFSGPPPLNDYRLRGEWAEWLARFPWTHFGTYTFQEPRQTVRSVVGCYRAYGRTLAERCGMRNRSFAVVEGRDGSTRLHLHSLSILEWDRQRAPARALLSPEYGLHQTAWREWFERYGRARVSPLGADGIGAAYYVAKYLLKEDEPRWEFLPSHGWERIVPA